MVAIGVVMIGLMIVVPSFQSLNKEASVSSQSQQFINAIHYARTEAITLNRNLTICNSENGTSCSTDTVWKGWLLAEVDGNNLRRVIQTGLFNQSMVVTLQGLKDRSIYSQLFITPQGFIRNGSMAPLSMQMMFCSPGKTLMNRKRVKIYSGGRVESNLEKGGEACNE
jgi:type IV fimbrial biogenesis protein FimT